MAILNSCVSCDCEFEVAPADTEFYQRIDVPPPSRCPDCRQQRRLTYRNERVLYLRPDSLSGKEIISLYQSDSPVTVCDQETWWSDSWDPLAFGREVDFARPFFDQYLELSQVVPRPAILNMSSENSFYTNHSAYNKNCYMCFNTGYSEDLYYCSNYNLYNKSCADCLAVQRCEQCYFSTDCSSCSFSSYLLRCVECSDCLFCYDCRGCNNCFGCWNLRRKQFCIYNQQYSREDYFRKLEELRPQTWTDAASKFMEFRERLCTKAVHRGVWMEKSEASSGDYVRNCKQVRECYGVFESEQCAYCYDAGELKTSWDALEPYRGELQYETHACNMGYELISCSKVYESSQSAYSQYSWYSQNIFGCFGVRNKQYCILNRQYSAEDYHALRLRLVSHMKETGEWGEFFPEQHSPFAYNETAASDYFPLDKQQVVDRGWKWRDPDPREYRPQTCRVPELITAVNDSIIKEVLACGRCGKNYRIVQQELKFYRTNGYPIPHDCPDCRHALRHQLRNPRRLYSRECAVCGKALRSSISPDRPEKVLCDKDYLAEVQ